MTVEDWWLRVEGLGMKVGDWGFEGWKLKVAGYGL